MKRIPMRGFVGMNDGAGLDDVGEGFDRSGFGFEHEGQRLAVFLAGDHDDATLAGLVDRKATVAAVLFVIRGLHIPAEVGAIDGDFAGNGFANFLGGKGLANFVGHDESGLVLAIEVARELQGTMALRAVDEDRDSQEVIANRALAAGEDRAGRDAELMVASLALEDWAGLEAVNAEATAIRASGLAVRGSPTDHAEGVAGFVVGHARNLGEAQRAGRRGEKKVLRHFLKSNDFRWPQ